MSNGIITQGAFPKNKRPGVFAWTELQYKEHPETWAELFFKANSEYQYEEAVSGNTFGLVPTKAEGSNIQYMSESQAYVNRSTHVMFAAGYQITFEEALNDLYEKVGKRRGSRLQRAFKNTKETVHANLFNRAFNSNYTFGDGSQLIATDHSTVNGNFSNRLATDADLSEAAAEDMSIQIRNAVDNVGNKMDLKPAMLLYHPNESFNACRILDSELQNDTANNAVNALKAKGTIPYHMDWVYLDDTDAWFITTDMAKTEDGLVHYERHPFTMGMDNDSDALVEKHFGFEYYSRTCNDPRAIFGTSGA